MCKNPFRAANKTAAEPKAELKQVNLSMWKLCFYFCIRYISAVYLESFEMCQACQTHDDLAENLLKEVVYPKNKNCHHLLTLHLFQTFWVSFFTNVHQTVDGMIDFHMMEKNTMEVNGYRQLFGYQCSANWIILHSVDEIKTPTGWNKRRVSKWWTDFHFWINYPFKVSF